MKIKENKEFSYTAHKYIGKKRIIYIFKIFFIVIIFLLGVYYSNKIKKSKPYRYSVSIAHQYSVIVKSLVNGDFSILHNIIKAKTAEIENFDIDINFKNWEKIRYYREKSLQTHHILKEFQVEVPAKIRYNNSTYKVGISLTGGLHEHLIDPEQWSFAINVKGDQTIMGMKKFAILVPAARGYLTDWIATKILISRGVIGLRSDFVDVKLNGNYHGVYYLEERFDKILIENSHLREGVIFKIDLQMPFTGAGFDTNLTDFNYYSNLHIYNTKRIKGNANLSAQLAHLNQLWHAFHNGDINAEQIFDLHKLASVFVVSDLLNDKHGLSVHNLRFYFNPITGLIEPIAREWMTINSEKKFGTLSIEGEVFISNINDNIYLRSEIINKIYDNILFKRLYIKEAEIISNQLYLDSIIVSHQDELDLLMNKIHKTNPFYEFPIKTLHKHQKLIRQKLYSSTPSIKVYFNGFENDSISLLIENITELPYEIVSIKYNEETILSEKFIIFSKHKANNRLQKITFKLNSGINKETFSSNSLMIYYNVLGIQNVSKNYLGKEVYTRTIVFPKKMSFDDYSNLNKVKQPANISDFNFLVINEEVKTVRFINEQCNVRKDLIIPKDYTVIAKPGVIINLTNSARIISYSPIMFFGRKDSIIMITSSDSSGQGIIVLNCDRISELSYVNFENLSNISDEGWYLTGAITFYESPVNISNCNFNYNLKGDDYLNIVRTHFNITNTIFSDTKADAFDADFCTGKIKNSRFIQNGNDAIDVSGCKLLISDIEIFNPGDKGISGGENSYLVCKNIKIKGGEIAIASKDNTTIKIDSIDINSSKLAYCAFQKKSEFGPGVIFAKNALQKNVKTLNLIEIGSSLTLNNKVINGKINNVSDLLYGSKYGKSSQ